MGGGVLMAGHSFLVTVSEPERKKLDFEVPGRVHQAGGETLLLCQQRKFDSKVSKREKNPGPFMSLLI